MDIGASLPSVVCSPLQVCDVGLQPGEVVNQIHVGDKVRWSIMPAVSGFGSERTTHLIVKPADGGLVTSILVYTDKRTYSIKLISTQSQWTPLTAFSYPENAQAAWANYGATMGSGKGPATTASVGGPDVEFYKVTAMPRGVLCGSLPKAARRTSNSQARCIRKRACARRPCDDGGWFTSPSEKMVRYRIAGNSTWSMACWTMPSW